MAISSTDWWVAHRQWCNIDKEAQDKNGTRDEKQDNRWTLADG